MDEKRLQVTEDQVRAALANVQDPDHGKDIVALGRVHGLVLRDGNVGFTIEVEAERGPALEGLRKEAEEKVMALPGVVSVTAVLTAERPAGSARSPGAGPGPAAQEPVAPGAGGREHAEALLPDVTHIVAVASGKGGVGKSTVAVNLAIALSQRGHGVGIMDADIYGPSMPTMLGIHDEPEIADVDGERKIIPLERHGLKVMSLGFLQPEDDPVIWRGPLVMRAVKQFLRDVDWRGCEVLVIDLPPGTGDAQLTLTQSAPIDGAIIVTTPQDVALIDARKGLHMFEEVDVPVLGIIENMSGYTCPECGHEAHIFRSGGGKRTADELGIPLLGGVPIDPSVAESGDAGTPVVLADPDSVVAAAFQNIADAVEEILKKG